MRWCLFSVCVLLLSGVIQAQNHPQSQGGTQYQSDCNYVTLVKCFIDILDEWAWTLYELRANVVTITPDQCTHLTRLDRCVKDNIPEGSLKQLGIDEDKHKHQCRHDEVVEASETVSDLLTHRKKAGSFLKSYYLLTYACSEEGQSILREHRECLKLEGINDMTLKAGTYLTTKFLDQPHDESCERIQEQLDEYMQSTGNLCKKKAAANLMCKSLIGMFKGMHADALEACDLKCNLAHIQEEAPNSNDVPETVPEQVATDSDAQTRRGGSSSTLPISQMFAFLGAFLLLNR
ncbi:unnamed protein product, partial [Mesorhabditis belari]|uniref:Secreted protein n=1 Tax=Mesorhabditis belari TaxID=2138241 RepID=A0AAF3J4I8_9BILA